MEPTGKVVNSGGCFAARYLAAVWVMVCLCIFCQPVMAASSVGLVLSGDDSYYRAVAEDIARYLATAQPGVEVQSRVVDDGPLSAMTDNELVVTIGTRASATVARQYPAVPQLSVMVTRQGWRAMAATSGELRHKAVIFIDQPVERYLLLARILVPEGKTFSTLLGPVAITQRDDLVAAAQRMEITLKHDAITMRSNPMQVLSPLFAGTDGFIVFPDQEVLNRTIAHWVLNQAFRKKIPVIGFSRSYGEAGAAAALFTAEDDIAKQSRSWLETYFDEGGDALWKEFSPDYFTVILNRTVVRGLGLPAMEEAEIQRRIAQGQYRSSSE